jgi:hypothetical protein
MCATAEQAEVSSVVARKVQRVVANIKLDRPCTLELGDCVMSRVCSGVTHVTAAIYHMPTAFGLQQAMCGEQHRETVACSPSAAGH